VTERESETTIIDLRGYVGRLLRHALPALVTPAILVIAGLVWTFTAPYSYESQVALVPNVPAVTSEAEATQQSALVEPLVASDLTVAKTNPDVFQEVLKKHPDLDHASLRTSVEIKQAGALTLVFKAKGNTPQEAAQLAEDYTSAFIRVADATKRDYQPPLSFTYTAATPADPAMVDQQSGRLPRIIITVAVAALGWVITAAALDARAQRRLTS
jgi:hypothetical protein